MNISNFTTFSMKNIGKDLRCKKSKTLCSSNSFLEYELGQVYRFAGFLCSYDEMSVIIESRNGAQDFIPWSEFSRHFVCLQTQKFALAGHRIR